MFFLLGGCCSTVSTNPREGGLMGGICGHTTGSYDNRIREREERLSAERDANQKLKEETADLDRKKLRLEREEKDTQEKIESLNQKILELEKYSESLKNTQGQEQGKVKALIRALDDLKLEYKKLQLDLALGKIDLPQKGVKNKLLENKLMDLHERAALLLSPKPQK
jgi:chromosome segregation ATPase